MMKRLSEINILSPQEFKRALGISKDNFQELLEKLTHHLAEQKEIDPMKKRGKKGELALGDRLLLTLYYLRNYATFLVLGQFFGISESYSNKVFHHISNNLMNILHVSNRKVLMNVNLDAVIIDVTEQQIEWPKKHQKDYYSGKKNVIRSKPN